MWCQASALTYGTGASITRQPNREGRVRENGKHGVKLGVGVGEWCKCGLHGRGEGVMMGKNGREGWVRGPTGSLHCSNTAEVAANAGGRTLNTIVIERLERGVGGVGGGGAATNLESLIGLVMVKGKRILGEWGGWAMGGRVSWGGGGGVGGKRKRAAAARFGASTGSAAPPHRY